MTVTNGRNLAGFAALINDSGKVIAEAFSTDLVAATRPTVYDSDGDVPFDAPKGSQAYVASEGLLLKLTDAAWYVLDGSAPEIPPADLPGTDRGYISGGFDHSNIYKFPFAASTSVSLVGNIVPVGTRHSPASASSKQNGYLMGGYQQPGVKTNEIRQFSFATDGHSVSRIGALTNTPYRLAGANSATHGYAAGGYDASGLSSLIQKYSFTIDGVSTSVGNLLSVRDMACGISSPDYGFVASGSGYSNQYGHESQIDKISFVSDGNSTYYGWNYVAKKGAAGLFSTTDGYIAAGQVHPPTGANHSNVQKFPFATESNSTTIGDLTYVLLQPAGSSSMEYGYVSGGQGPTGVSSRMSRFVWASTVTDETIGNLAVGGWGQSGYQI